MNTTDLLQALISNSAEESRAILEECDGDIERWQEYERLIHELRHTLGSAIWLDGLPPTVLRIIEQEILPAIQREQGWRHRANGQ